jgi:hypothetical protein
MMPNLLIVSRTDRKILLRDVGPWDRHKTITNDIETVISELWAGGFLEGSPRFFYYDSEGELTEALYSDGLFLSFKHVPDAQEVLAL